MAISPGTPLLTPKDIKYRIAASGADAIFCPPNLAPAVDEIENELGKSKISKIMVGGSPEQKRFVFDHIKDVAKIAIYS